MKLERVIISSLIAASSKTPKLDTSDLFKGLDAHPDSGARKIEITLLPSVSAPEEVPVTVEKPAEVIEVTLPEAAVIETTAPAVVIDVQTPPVNSPCCASTARASPPPPPPVEVVIEAPSIVVDVTTPPKKPPRGHIVDDQPTGVQVERIHLDTSPVVTDIVLLPSVSLPPTVVVVESPKPTAPVQGITRGMHRLIFANRNLEDLSENA